MLVAVMLEATAIDRGFVVSIVEQWYPAAMTLLFHNSGVCLSMSDSTLKR
jgi:hypothetical protein